MDSRLPTCAHPRRLPSPPLRPVVGRRLTPRPVARPLVAALALCSAIQAFSPLSAAPATDGGTYVTQSYVDTLVERAILNFNQTDALAATGMTRERAIAEGKRIIRKLRTIAETDANRKYILWKVGELESHVYLEEQGLLLEKQKQAQVQINNLVPLFNAETGRMRPDFGRLWSLQKQFESLDRNKGAEIHNLIAERAKNISREVLQSLQYALNGGDMDRAREELGYIKSQEGHLQISQTVYTRLAAKVQSKISLDDELAFVRAQLKKGFEHLSLNRLQDAMRTAEVVSLRLDLIKDGMIRLEWDKFDAQARKIVNTVAAKQDSLTAAALAVLKKEGVSAAKDFLETGVKVCGVSGETVSRIEYEIMQVAMAQRRPVEDTAMHKEFAALPDSSAAGASLLSDMMAAARRKARAKADSARMAAMAEKGGITQIEEVRRERMAVAAAGMKDREAGRRDGAQEAPVTRREEVRRERAQVAMTAAQEREAQILRDNREKAEKKLVQIYTQLERKKLKDAWEEFRDDRDYLKKYLPADSYRELDSTVSVQCAEVMKKR